MKAKLELGGYPTPFYLLKRLSEDMKRGPIYIKRDDIGPLGLGGNKLRKLQYLLQDALERGFDKVMTYGGPQTNHGRLTAAAAAHLGLGCALYLKGKRPENLSGNLLLDRLFGAELYFSDDEPGRDRELIESGYYSIPMGGSNVLGAMGYVDCAQELKEDTRGLAVRHLIHASGSMGTQAGLLLGAKRYGLDFSVHGVQVMSRGEGLEEDIFPLLEQGAEMLGMDGIAREKVHFEWGSEEDPYAGLGYNVPDEKTREAVRYLARLEGILLDPCYTGKAFRGMLDMMKRGVIEEGTAVVFLHTGGAPGLWSQSHFEAWMEDERASYQE